jgi:medium-chain acyl-[acyl-carrier-protein] hydrolase
VVPEVWAERFRILSYDCEPTGRASLPALFAFLLESAGDHATAGGFGFEDMMARGLIWVLTRFKLVVESYPSWSEEVGVETWAKGRDGLFYTRDYYLKDAAGAVLGRATSSWAALDARTHRPETGEIFVRDFPQRPDMAALTEKLQKVPPLDAPGRVSEYRVRFSDLDFNRHVNSMRYVEWMLNGLDEGTRLKRTVGSMEVNYLAESRLGDEVLIRIQEAAGPPASFLCSVAGKSDDRDLARAKFELA